MKNLNVFFGWVISVVQSTGIFSVLGEWKPSFIGSYFLFHKFPKTGFNNVLH